MILRKPTFSLTAMALGALLSKPALAHNDEPRQDALIASIISDVILLTSDNAHADLERRVRIDPYERGYRHNRQYQPPPRHLRNHLRHALQELDRQYDRDLRAIERELQHELRQAEGAFRREAARGRHRHHIADKRHKLERKVDRAYRRYEDKLQRAADHYDRKRDKLLYGYRN